ncbi:unnamed protein product [Rangifer tarandus platyrhynchus]|uniref:Uncharacterized protein n=2 Tax=Rangifer tarandus platyrhynchus TaxID=3082113 RepID=A0ABN9A004_RANTA|nr:unnamed protein product [Rangifer tarandus platyrhynchus]
MPPQTLVFQNPRPGKPLYWFPKAAAQVPQTGWDRIAEIYCLIVLEVHFQGVSRVMQPLKPWEKIIPCFSSPPGVVCVCARMRMHMHTCMCVLSSIQLFAILRTVACHAPLSVGFVRQEYWSGLPFPSPGDLPDPGVKPESLASPALVGGFFTSELPGEPTWVGC